ncbi:MAG TPA: hypothetical protein VHA75_20705 [Rugosimonospora sp.]|nr:hypothetical protein [Rugosimonospora sp.]
MAENEPTRAELVELCKAAGLPYYGSKADLVARLVAHEAAPSEPSATPSADPEPADLDPDPDPFADPADGEPTVAPGEGWEPLPVAAVAPGVFTAVYPVDEWDEDTHGELCSRVVADAQALGLHTRGGGRRVSGDGRLHTYGVSVR